MISSKEKMDESSEEIKDEFAETADEEFKEPDGSEDEYENIYKIRS